MKQLNFSKKDRKTIAIFVTVMSVVLAIVIGLILFVSDLSDLLASLLKIDANLVKIIAASWIPLIFFLFYPISNYTGKTLFYVLYILTTILSIIGFYFITAQFFKALPKEQKNNYASFLTIINWFKDFGKIYIWYASPVITPLYTLPLVLGDRIQEKKVPYIILYTIILICVVVVSPLLISLVGQILTILGIAIVVIFGASICNSSGPKYSTSDGHTLTQTSYNNYVDENGNSWESDDNGRTAHKK